MTRGPHNCSNARPVRGTPLTALAACVLTIVACDDDRGAVDPEPTPDTAATVDAQLDVPDALDVLDDTDGDAAAPGPDTADASTERDLGSFDTADVASDARDASDDSGTSERPSLLDVRLSDTAWFAGPVELLAPSESLVPFSVAVPFFSDHLHKQRYVALPAGSNVTVRDDELVWPNGAALVKVMSDPATTDRPWVEVRALVFDGERWWPGTWTWDGGLNDGVPVVDGATIERAHPTDPEAGRVSYAVPSTMECERCHGGDDPQPLGFVARQLDHAADSGAASLVGAGVLTAPLFTSQRLSDPAGDAPLDERARSWLAVNCGSCHARGEAGARRGLVLTLDATAEVDLGICRYETIAAPTPPDVFWIVSPGDAAASALWYRAASLDPAARMPDVPHATIDEHGVDLVRRWIDAMDVTPCSDR